MATIYFPFLFFFFYKRYISLFYGRYTLFFFMANMLSLIFQGSYAHFSLSCLIYSFLFFIVDMLCFDLLTRPKMPFKVMHRKEVTHSDGSYVRKTRGRKLTDEMGRGKKKKSHYTLIDWRTGRKWPLNCMTVISARWRSHRPSQR